MLAPFSTASIALPLFFSIPQASLLTESKLSQVEITTGAKEDFCFEVSPHEDSKETAGKSAAPWIINFLRDDGVINETINELQN